MNALKALLTTVSNGVAMLLFVCRTRCTGRRPSS